MKTSASLAKVLPPVYRQIRQWVLLLEQAVMRFSRYHKYGVGADLRQQAMMCWRWVHRACHDGGTVQAQHVQALVWAVDELKLTLQLAHAGVGIGKWYHAENGRLRRHKRRRRLLGRMGRFVLSRVPLH